MCADCKEQIRRSRDADTLIYLRVFTISVRDVIFFSSTDTHIQTLTVCVCVCERACVLMKQCVLKGDVLSQRLIKASQRVARRYAAT